MNKVSDTVANAKAWWNSQTVIGSLLFLLPMVVKMIKPELTLDLEAGTNEVFQQAGDLAVHADAAWTILSDSLGKVLIALGIRKAAGGTPLKAY
jgi:hypothetical protein